MKPAVRRLLGRGLVLGLIAVTVGLGIARLVRERRYQSGLLLSRALVSAQRFDEALPWLAEQARSSAADAEILYLAGISEHASGHVDEALADWSRIPENSKFSDRAMLARAQTLVGDRGRFADAEPLLEKLRKGRGTESRTALYALSQLYFYQGRLDEMRNLLESRWEQSSNRVGDLRDHWRIDTASISLDEVRAEIAKAAALSPDDDRVRLAWANLAILKGDESEAKKQIDFCLAKRPEDPAVQRARLRWAKAFNRPEEARAAMDKLAPDRFTLPELLEHRAWLAGPGPERRKALEELVKLVPGSTEAFEQLAVMTAEAGELERSKTYRRLKDDADRIGEQYMRLLEDGGPPSTGADFAERAKLAEALGRRFEARSWWTLALLADRSNATYTEAVARLDASKDPVIPGSFKTLALAVSNGLADPKASSGPKPARLAIDPGPAPRFVDRAEAAGLNFRFENGRSLARQLPETSAGGLGLIDYDGDGFLDVYLIQGGVFPPDPSKPAGDRLFRNLGDGKFQDVTEATGITSLVKGYGHGVTVGDFDGDGRPDLFLARWRGYTLLRNLGNGKFADATEAAGLGGDRDWPTSAAFADLDGDGDLDLYVCHYTVWDESRPTTCARKQEGVPPTADDGSPNDYCNPNPFKARPDHLFRNDKGKFVDVSDAAGITAADRDGRGFGVVAADLDDDGRIDLFVSNDTTANYLFHNKGNLVFEEVGMLSGVATGTSGGYQAGMGVACGDLDGDGRPDLFVTNFYGESTTYYQNLGNLLFTDQSTISGLAAPSRFLLGFGIALFDFNNDGYLDVTTTNGHVNDLRPKFPYAMPGLLLAGSKGGRLTDVTSLAGPAMTAPRVGRALVSGDLDNDGRSDLIVVGQNEPVALLQNQGEVRPFVSFRLEGTRSNRDGIGAKIKVTAGGRTQTTQRSGGGGFQSSGDPRVHFGLGEASTVDSIEVTWPSGQVDRHAKLAAGRGYLLKEGVPQAEPLPGSKDR